VAVRRARRTPSVTFVGKEVERRAHEVGRHPAVRHSAYEARLAPLASMSLHSRLFTGNVPGRGDTVALSDGNPELFSKPVQDIAEALHPMARLPAP
jgi:hypothetical protein